jgi:ketosteroid isomerase-like protein
MGANGPEGGKSAIERTMRQGFWKTGRPLQNLRYEHVEVRMLGKDHALVTGQYVLSGAERPDRTGWFTTVWTRTQQGWRMIHDHS